MSLSRKRADAPFNPVVDGPYVDFPSFITCIEAYVCGYNREKYIADLNEMIRDATLPIFVWATRRAVLAYGPHFSFDRAPIPLGSVDDPLHLDRNTQLVDFRQFIAFLFASNNRQGLMKAVALDMEMPLSQRETARAVYWFLPLLKRG